MRTFKTNVSTADHDKVQVRWYLLGHVELLSGVKAELLLHISEVLITERATVNSLSSLLLRAEANGGADFDDGRLVGNLLGLLNGTPETVKVVVACRTRSGEISLSKQLTTWKAHHQRFPARASRRPHSGASRPQ